MWAVTPVQQEDSLIARSPTSSVFLRLFQDGCPTGRGGRSLGCYEGRQRWLQPTKELKLAADMRPSSLAGVPFPTEGKDADITPMPATPTRLLTLLFDHHTHREHTHRGYYHDEEEHVDEEETRSVTNTSTPQPAAGAPYTYCGGRCDTPTPTIFTEMDTQLQPCEKGSRVEGVLPRWVKFEEKVEEEEGDGQASHEIVDRQICDGLILQNLKEDQFRVAQEALRPLNQKRSTVKLAGHRKNPQRCFQ
ncbi:electrogenic sodium bicarbonate cotransporter 4 isoform X1, partial [Lates japonicus]